VKERILKIVKSEKINLSKFAEKIGVQRSSISHIISGRNKPSLDFVMKVLDTFTAINSEWLLFGKGKMYLQEKPELFAETEPTSEVVEKPIEKQAKKTLPQKKPTKVLAEKVETKPNIKIQVPPEKQTDTSAKIPTEQIIAAVSKKSEKTIERVLIFYSDKTFVDFARGEW